jgi:hypothetical protein
LKNNDNFDSSLTRSSGIKGGGHSTKLRWIIIGIIGLVVVALLAVGGNYLHQRSDFSAKDPNSSKIIEIKVQR